MRTHSLLEQILISRGILDKTERELFLNPSYDNGLHDPMLLPDIAKAIERITVAIESKEQIVVYGDYDIDGLTATTLLLDALTAFGATVSAYIPDRFEEGYGINTKALQKLKKSGAELIITVDCGSTSIEPIEWAQNNNLDIIVTDHHELGDTLPGAVAIINPKRRDSIYPFNDLAGVGVAFKLVQALQISLPGMDESREKWLLDLVALGTVCDVVELRDENRIFVRYGLKVLQKSRRIGLVALRQVSGIENSDLKTYHLGFVLGPRLNAAGRLEHAKLALELLTTKDPDSAERLAVHLDRLNQERRVDQARILAEADQTAADYKDDAVLVLADPGWSHGIVGIVAAKLVEKWHKPVLLLQNLGEESKGSARSLGEFNFVEGLRSVSQFLLKFGGHHFAAGCTLKTADINKVREGLNSYYRSLKLGSQAHFLDVKADVVLEDLAELNFQLLEAFENLEPCGRGNQLPLFQLNNMVIIQAYGIGSDGQHLKLKIKDSNGVMLDGIGFNMGHAHQLNAEQRISLWAELQKNEYNGRTSLQLVVQKINA